MPRLPLTSSLTLEEEALAFANSVDRQDIECPRGVLNPGLYYGFIAGYNTLLDQQLKAMITCPVVEKYKQESNT